MGAETRSGADLSEALHLVVRRALGAIPGAARGCLLLREGEGLICGAAVDGETLSDALVSWPDLESEPEPKLRWAAARDVYSSPTGAADPGGGVLLAPIELAGSPCGYLAVELTAAERPIADVAVALPLLADAAGLALLRHRIDRQKTQIALEVRFRDEVLDGITVSTGMNDVTESVAQGIKLLLPHRRWNVVNISLLGEDGRDLLVHQISQRPTDSYWSNVRRGMQAAGRDYRTEVEFRAGGSTGEGSQSRLIDEAVARGFDAVAVAMSAPELTEPAIRRACEAGIPVIAFDSPPMAGSASLLYIGTDNLAAGRLAGEVMTRLLPGGGKVASLVGTRQVPCGDERIGGFESAVAGTALHYLACLEDQRDLQLGPRLTGTLLSEHADLAGVFGAWDDNGPTWAAALTRAGRAGQVKVVAFDLHADTVASIQEGAIHATVVQREAEMGYRCVETLCQMIAFGVAPVIARLPSSRVVDVGVDVVTLHRTPWSTALAEHLTRRRWAPRDQETIASVVREGRSMRVMVIGMSWPTRGEVVGQRVPFRPSSLMGELIRSGAPLVVDPASHEQADLEELFTDRQDQLRTLAFVPLSTHDGVIGAILAGSDREGACAPSDLGLLQRIASAASVAVANAQMLEALTRRAAELQRTGERDRILLKTILELSCPVLPVAPGVLVVPLVGTIDTDRWAHFMDTVLKEIADHRARVVIIDTTGTAAVDDEAAARLADVTSSARLLGAEVMIVGVAAGVAQTLAERGLDLGPVTVHATLERGFAHALATRNARIVYRAR